MGRHIKEEKDFLREFKIAIQDEISFIEKNGFNSIMIRNGRCVRKNKSDFWYEFDVEFLVNLPEDTPCNLVVGESSFEVVVISYKGTSLIVSCKNELKVNLNKARLDSGATILLERLLKRIEQNENKENHLGRYLYPKYKNDEIRGDRDHIDLLNTDKSLNKEQRDAVVSALKYPVTFIWGPPGTGKTHVIGEIITKMIQMDRTVLLVSHTNTAVDGAIKKANERYKKTIAKHEEPHPILRLGNDRLSKDAENCKMSEHKKQEAKELTKEGLECELEKKRLEEQIEGLERVTKKHEWIKNSRIGELQDASNRIESLGRIHSELNMKINQNEDDTKEYIAKHPGYRSYEIIEERLLQATKEREEQLSRMTELQKFLEEAPYEIEAIEVELKQYKELKELKVIEGKQFSIENQKNRIEAMNKTLNEIGVVIKNLETSKQMIDDKITDAGSKNFAYAFFHKKDTEAIKKESKEYEVKIDEKKEELKLFEQMQLKAKDQLSISIINHKVMSSFKFTDSEKGLVNRIQILRHQLATSEKMIGHLQSELRNNEIICADLLEEYTKVKPMLQFLTKLKLERDSLTFRRKAILEESNEWRSIFESILQSEKEFYKINIQPDSRDYFCTPRMLQNAYIEIQNEISHDDLEEIYLEIKLLSQTLGKVLYRLKEIESLLLGIDRKIILERQVIGTTLVQSYLNDILNERVFDTLIIDEASMASNPTIWAACYLAHKSVVIVGDSRQLPPIVMSSSEMAEKWMRKDIFTHSDLDYHNLFDSENTVALKQQYRMEKEIENVANSYYGFLESGETNNRREKEKINFNEWYPKELGERDVNLIDTSNLHAWVTGIPRGKGSSRLNLFSATLCVELAFLLLEKKIRTEQNGVGNDKRYVEPKPEILIVTPYKPHAQKIEELIKYECERRNISGGFPLISVGTIHKFQGNEASIVIFDLVLDEPHWRANLFMPDDDEKQQEKLFTVAVTRAKFKLFVVGNFPFLRKRAKNNALCRLLDKLEEFPLMDARSIFPDIRYAKKIIAIETEYEDKGILCKEDTFYDYFLYDVQKAERRVIIYSPFISQSRLGIMLPYFMDKVSEGVSITVVTKPLDNRSKAEKNIYKNYIEKLREIGVHVVFKKDMHEKTALIDHDRVWNGSLNILSSNSKTGEIMRRFISEDEMKGYCEIFSIDSLVHATENNEELKCPNCGADMMLAEGSKGGVYWTCVNGDYSRQPNQEYAKDGVIKCHCGAPYSFSMKNQPRWVCTSKSHHYRKIRKSDLKLENMMKLIPKSERKRLFKYFNIESMHDKKVKKYEKDSANGQLTLFDL